MNLGSVFVYDNNLGVVPYDHYFKPLDFISCYLDLIRNCFIFIPRSNSSIIVTLDSDNDFFKIL